ncbi:AraC family transcriptional regulator [Maridesulfovibrio sp.]|uniref:helix-turn-helix transcriptional regulator n=1 Tax=Maridesulfovibrio sp. TaxID=2795000 RepID=UPI002A189C41|nr:AraC family transcriptional regulator [Maridesulfovibrio sp.]
MESMHKSESDQVMAGVGMDLYSVWKSHESFEEKGENFELLSSSEGLNWNGIAVCRVRVHRIDRKDCSAPFHCFSLMTEEPGSLDIVNECSRYSVVSVPGQLYIRPANQMVSVKSLDWGRSREFIHVALDQSRIADSVDGAFQGKTLSFRPGISVDDSRLKALIEALAAEAEAGGPNGLRFVDSLTTALAVHYVSNYSSLPYSGSESGRRLSRDQLTRAVEYMDAHIGSNLTIEDLAHEVGMSKYYFSRLFKEDTGATPYQFFLARRLEKARMLLDEGRNTITEIAHLLNFSDQSHFSRVFRKKFGMNPKSYIEHLS